MSKKLYEGLAKVQTDLKAPKSQYNKFGKYYYRNKEDIFEAAKPLCAANGLVLTVDDELVLIGDRYYIMATATVTEVATGDMKIARGYAREALVKKGMDESQITGATASYAGKYALGNLFGIDDTKDADATQLPDAGEKPAVAARTATAKPPVKPTATKATKDAVKAKVKDTTKTPVKAETPAPTSKTSGKADAKKAMTDVQKANFLKGIGEGKFDLVEKHLKNYKADANSKAVTAALNKAKTGK